jgi:hypothetical protein
MAGQDELVKIVGKNKGKYVAMPGSRKSYTNKGSVNMRIYRTYEQAEKNRCPENEIVINLERN